MQPIQLPAAAAAWLKHLQRCGLTHLPQAEPLPAELTAAWWVPAESPPDPSEAARSSAGELSTAARRSPSAHSHETAPRPDAASLQPVTAGGSSAELAASGRPSRAVTPPTLGQSDLPQRWSTAAESPERRGLLLEQLCQEVGACQRCPKLVASRSRTVFGDGPVTPRVAFFGEAPGADEDRAGIPFVGRAGQLLDKIIAATGMQRSEVYILNAVKCRPQDNRTPEEDEVSNCRPYFERQLELLQPEYVVLLGAVAVRAVLGSQAPIGRLRGTWYQYRGAKVLVTYHPAYLLRNEASKRLTWEDMKMLMQDMGLPIPPAAGRRG